MYYHFTPISTTFLYLAPDFANKYLKIGGSTGLNRVEENGAFWLRRGLNEKTPYVYGVELEG
jgi:hypothetical protein